MDIDFGQLITSSPGDVTTDSSGLVGNTLEVAKNVIPVTGGYSSFPAKSTASSAGLSARAQGAFSAIAPTQIEDFAGDATKLYRMTAATGAWTDVSKGGGYDTAAADFWEFTQFGNKVIATNNAEAVGSGGDPPQVWTLGSSANFADLGGSPPHAKHIAVIRDFVVLGHTYDTTDLEKQSRVRWSGFANEASWPTNVSERARTQSDWQDLNTGHGAVTRIVGGQSGIVFQERAVSIMTYDGPPNIFRLDQVLGAEGTSSPLSVVEARGAVYYYGESGFYRIGRDGSYNNISHGRVDALVEGAVDAGEETRFIIGAYDAVIDCIIWLYGGSSAGATSNAMIYSITNDKWATLDLSGASDLYELCYTSSIDSAGIGAPSASARYFKSTDHKSYRHDSFTTMLARIDTRFIELVPGRLSMPQKIRAKIKHDDSGAAPFTTKSLYIFSYSNRLVAQPSRTLQTLNSSTGYWQGRNNARYHRFNIELEATYPFTVSGLLLDDVVVTGKR